MTIATKSDLRTDGDRLVGDAATIYVAFAHGEPLNAVPADAGGGAGDDNGALAGQSAWHR